MGRSRLAWAGKSVAPWGLAMGLLVSITAQAGQEIDVSGAPRQRLAVDAAGGRTIAPPLITARYEIGSSEELAAGTDEIQPNTSLKPNRAGLPRINAADKSDPFIALRPGFDAKARAAFVASLATGDVAGWSADSRSPAAAAALDAPEIERRAIVYGDGATPKLPLAFALRSQSPRPSETKARMASAAPTAVAAPQPPTKPVALPVAPPGMQIVQFGAPNPAKPNYATLIDPKDSTRQMRCLAEAVYFEARSEPEAGQAAVAQVVLNRVRSGIFPTNVCGVVYQDANHPFACQFSFACEGKSLRVEEPASWATATRIAKDVVDGSNYNPKLVEAVNYHATYVYPFWAPTLRKVDKVGMHIFYTMRPGLYWAPGALNGRGDLPPLQQAAAK